jgi:hypothetical protein
MTIQLDLDTADFTRLPETNTPEIASLVDAAAADAAAAAPEAVSADAPAAPAEPAAPAVEAEPERPLRPSTIRPGLMVVLRVAVRGNVSYTKEVIQSETITPDGKAKEKWQTEKTIVDPVEHVESVKVRSRARQIVTNVCTPTTFGLLCPMDKEKELNEAIRESRKLVTEFNLRAKTTKIGMIVIAGKVADSDVEAARAINAEVNELMQAMEVGLKNLDVKAVRDAADKAKQLGSMLSDNASEKLKEAIEVARKAATAMKKAAETGAAEIDLVAIQKITNSRTAFLDHDMAGEIEAPVHEGRALDLAPMPEDETSIAPAAEQRETVQIDL